MSQTVARLRSASGNPAHQTVQYFYKRIKYNDIDLQNSSRATIATMIGVIPANCVPLETYVRVNTAFTSGDIIVGTTIAAGTTATLSGTVVSTQDLQSGTSGLYIIDRFMANYSTADVPVYFYTATSGGGAGEADLWQFFVLAGPTT